jgi:hypothetical protein
MSIEQKLRERIGRGLARGMGQPISAGVVDAVMADTLVWHEADAARREQSAFCQGALHGWHRAVSAADGEGFVTASAPAAAAERYPLPKRTRRVLREEPVPGYSAPTFRCRDGKVEWSHASHHGWQPYLAVGTDNFSLLRHLLDLHDNPCREVEEPTDEANPWGDA